MPTAKLQITKDYSKFELCQFNRSVSKKKNLLASMKTHGYIPAYPIHCNKAESGRLQIKAGHHRFECAQELGLPVYFVVSDDAATIHELEKATNQWTLYDYLESYIRCGLPEYARLKQYWQETGISLQMCISILGGESASSHNLAKQFKDGSFLVRGEDHASEIRDIVLHCRELGICTDQMFIQAISRCLRVEQFSSEIFKMRCTSNVTMLRKCRTLADQMQMFEDIYNYKSSPKNRLPLCFLADQTMKARSAVSSGTSE